MKAFLNIFIFAVLLPASAMAAYQRPRTVATQLNTNPPGSVVQEGTWLVDKSTHVLRAQWDWNNQGGAVSNIVLQDLDGKPAVLPPGAIVKNCMALVDVALKSSGSAKVSLSTGQIVGDALVPTAYTSFATNDGLVGCTIVPGTLATWVKLPGNYTQEYTKGYTSAYTPTMGITGAALTSGKIRFLLEYILSR